MYWLALLLVVLYLTCTCAISQTYVNYEEYEFEYPEPGTHTENCICVPHYQCANEEIIDDGSVRETPIGELPIEENYIPPACGPFQVCCRQPGAVTQKPYQHRCGSRNPNGINGRILSAQGPGEAEFGEWPWQAAVLRKEGETFDFKCGGTLIDEQHVITAAHCAEHFRDTLQSMVVRLGEWDTQNASEFLPHEDFTVAEIIVHPEYKSNNFSNDLAILKLADIVQFKPHIDTACLPRDEDNVVGTECAVTGWGSNAYTDNGTYSVIMKEVSVPVISNAECQAILRKTRLGKYFKLDNGFLCAGGESGKDSCKGDGGSPLVCYRHDNTYTVAGLVSWGVGCGIEGRPSVYLNVQKYIDWIATKTGKQVTDYWSTP